MLKKLWVIHPFLFAIFPILFLFAYNIDEVPANALLLPMLVVIIGTLILFFLLRLVTKNYNKAAIITSSFLILFFQHGRIRDVIISLEPGRFIQGNVGLLLASLWVLLLITGTLFIIKSRRNFLSFTKLLNIVAVTLVMISLINIAIYEAKTINLGQEQINKEGSNVNAISSNKLPDIYYIILDGYARSSTLTEMYNYDNSEFTDYLTNKGFYVASKSRSNYSYTHLSLPSSLNMEYINYLSDTVDIESLGATIIRRMVQDSKVSQLLKSVGYHYIFVSNHGYGEEMRKYAYVYTLPPKLLGIRISHFTVRLTETTVANWFISPWLKVEARGAFLYVFDTLADVPNINQPTFVFAFVLSPHPPFLFDRDGNPVNTQNDTWQYKEAYIDQLIFLNKKVMTLVDEILLKSDIPPIIILQADHGPKSTRPSEASPSELTNAQIDEVFNIFNAYYLPNNGSRLLYESITPVNSFRIVFNHYFDTDYELLEDESYFSNAAHNYKFFLVPPETDCD